MTEDGGCAESLNVSLDHSELAPSFIPEDVTKELGLPDDLQAEKVFVHKTANYENTLLQSGNKVVAYTKDGNAEIVTFAEGESMTDIDAIGNIVIVTTGESVYYALWKNSSYKFIGTSLPVPSIRFDVIGNDDENFETSDRDYVRIDTTGEIPGVTPLASFDKAAWEKAARGVAANEETNTYMATLKADFWAKVQQLKEKIGKWGYFSCPRLVRYAIKLYDGSYVYHSVPILIGAGEKEWLSVSGSKVDPSGVLQSSKLDFVINLYYRAIAKLISWDVEDWTDIITGVDIFISEDITFPRINEDFATCDDGGGKVYFKGYDNAFENTKQEILDKVNFYKIVSVAAGDLDSLKAGIDLHRDNDVEQSEDLLVKERLTSDYMMSHKVVPGTMMNFNSRLLVNASKVELPDPYTQLNGVFCNVKLAFTDNDFNHQRQRTYRYKFFIRRNDGEEYSILAKTPDGSVDFNTNLISNGAPSQLETKWYADPMAWIAYPDPNCYKVEIDLGAGDIAVVDMSAHPGLSCAYAFIGLDEYWKDYDFFRSDSEIDLTEKKTYSVNSQVILSEFSNPFVFPAGNRYTLQSKVLGIALATTALSQGQFGQFPLYVFTEDGIWAMETAADGSFVTSKPLSRDVCINPDSITSIDSAVVFVTDKGVMLLQGSQVVNISPNMNGRHYTIEETAKVILEKTIEDTIAKISKTPVDQMAQVIQNEVSQSISQQETRASIERTAQSIIAEEEFFKDLLPILSDSTHFMAFVKDATIAYDYSGKRLVFIKKDEKYQYIYKIDTNTWHKTAYGIDMVAPINSYPKCMVQGVGENLIRLSLYVEDAYMYDDQTFDLFVGEVEYLNILSEEQWREMFFSGKSIIVAVTEEKKTEIDEAREAAERHAKVSLAYEEEGKVSSTRIYNLSTPLDVESQTPTKGVIVTRPFDLEAPDVLKTITDIKIRGQYARGAVKFMLLGSMDGVNFYVIGTKRGKAWKLFRLIILADLDPTERVSWVDVIFEERFTNRLR